MALIVFSFPNDTIISGPVGQIEHLKYIIHRCLGYIEDERRGGVVFKICIEILEPELPLILIAPIKCYIKFTSCRNFTF